jgi:hypothetical protein
MSNLHKYNSFSLVLEIKQIDEITSPSYSRVKPLGQNNGRVSSPDPNLNIQNIMNQFNSGQSRGSTSNFGKIMELLSK